MKGKKAIYVLLVLLAAGVEIGTAANDNIELSKMIGYAFFALALILAAFAFGYTPFFIRRLKKRRKGEEEKDRVEEVIKILKDSDVVKIVIAALFPTIPRSLLPPAK